MQDIDEKVMSVVEEALRQNPKASVDDLFEIARGVNPSVADLNKRQFNARYPLQVKRKLAPPRRRKPRKAKAAAGKAHPKAAASQRELVRASFLRFASDLAGAEARQDVVRVVAGVDSYVDEVLKGTGHA